MDDAAGVVSTYAYDVLNRNTSVVYTNDPASTPTVTRTYDGATNGKGKLWKTETAGANGSRTIINSYNALGAPTSQSQQFYANSAWSLPFTVSATYGLSGQILTLIYPSGHTASYVYDNAGRTSSFAGYLGDNNLRTYSSEMIYSAFGAMTKEKFGTDTAIYNKLLYNSRGQLAEIRESTTSATDTSFNLGAIINHYSNQADCWGATCNATDNNGNLRRQEVYIRRPNSQDSDNFAQFYDYDSLNRLESARETLNNSPTEHWQQTYVYDRYGNRTIEQDVTKTYGAGINKKAFTVNTANNRLGVPGGQTGTMTYDAAGNLTTDTYSGLGVTRAYDAENRMTQETQASSYVAGSYTYNADGQRVRRTVGGQPSAVTTWQAYGLGGELLAEYAASAAPTTPQKEYGYRNGQLLITAAGGSGGSGSQNVTWTNVVGVSTSGNSLTKSIGDGWNAGAVSTQTINSGDGYLEFTASETSKYRRAGLSQGDTSQSWEDIDFCLYLSADGSVYINEGTNARGNFGSYATGDVFRVAVEGGVVKYRRNGTLLYTSTIAPTYPLLVDTALYSTGATLTNVILATTQNVGWTNVVGVSTSGNSLTKSIGDGWNAGAVSTQTINSGDGYLEFTASETNKHRRAGLSQGDTSQSWEDIDFCLYLSADGSVYINEGTNARGNFGSYATGDVFRVAVEGGVVKYRKNGTLLYTSTIAPTYPLLVDTALYSNGSTLTNVVLSGSAATADINWLVTDQLGTPRMVFDLTGTLAGVKRHDYLPFGEELFAGTGGRTPAMGYSADNVRQKFTDKERDIETGLDYFTARYYASTSGRFTSPDPYSVVAEIQFEEKEKAQHQLHRYLSEPQQWNRYPYAINNPLKYVDPTGEKIKLTGETDAERAAALQELRNFLGEERFKLVTVSADGRFYSLSNENVTKMQAIGSNADEKDLSTGMAEMLNSSAVVEFRVVGSFTNAGGHKIDLNTYDYGGALTVSGANSSNGNVQIFVHPQAGAIATTVAKGRGGMRQATSDGRDLVITTQGVVAHELGHGVDRMNQQGPRAMGAKPSPGPRWQTFENAVRSRDPNNSQRRKAH